MIFDSQKLTIIRAVVLRGFPADKNNRCRGIMSLPWLHRGLSKLLPAVLLVGVLLCISRNLQLVPECRSEELTSLLNKKDAVREDSPAQELLTLTNQQRVRQGLQPLVLDEALTKIAREHSQDMVDQGFISHDQPSGDLKTRMNRAGFQYEVARENLASAQTIAKAHAALLSSPIHRANILASDITRIGIGVTRCQETCGTQLYITEVFADAREEYQPAMVQTAVAHRVDALRQMGAGAMLPNPVLEEMAQRSIQSINMPYKSGELRNLAAASVSELQAKDRSKFSKLEIAVQLVHNPKKLSIPPMGHDGQARMYGSAVRQVTDSNNQTAFLVLTLIGIAR
jgi:uncharacterized protein YkwD